MIGKSIQSTKGYALISSKYLEGEGNNYHIFYVKKLYKKNNDKFDIEIYETEKCEHNPKPKQYKFENLLHRCIFLIDSHYLTTYKSKKNYFYEYYVADNGNIYYFPDEITSKIVIASFIDRKACGSCMSILYGDNS